MIIYGKFLNRGGERVSKKVVRSQLEHHFRKVVQKDDNITNAYLLVHSEKDGIHINMAEGKTGDFPAHPEQPFFIASIDKLLISVLIGLLVEQGRLSYDDPIANFIDSSILQDLHIYNGIDYTHDIKLKHLLNHTSGLFGDAVEKVNGSSMLDILLDELSHPYEKDFIIEWSKQHLAVKAPPGEKFVYSDIGYYLLILIIENVAEKPYPEFFKENIIQPLEMNHTYLLQYTEPLMEVQYPVADCLIHNRNVVQNTRLGMDYAGGRVVSTTEDLLIFMKALVGQKILGQETMEKMKDWAKYFVGIDYGYRIMRFKHVPVFMPKKYEMWGHAGSNGSFMFYHPELDVYFIGCLNLFRSERNGIRLIFKMVDILMKNKHE